MFDLPRAHEYVRTLGLSGARSMAALAPEEAEGALNQAKAQAQVVGSTLFSFAPGVGIDVREAISDSALLAQLAANKQAAGKSPLEWFAAYSAVLQNVGWVLQERTFTDHSTTGTAVEVHEKIIELMTTALGPGTAALAIVNATVAALRGMKDNSPWITIFSREAVKASIARFQIGLVEQDAGGGVFVSLLACLVGAQNNITQVLFFKFKSAQASFQAHSDKVSINRAALVDLGPTIRKRVRAYQMDYLSGVLDIEL